ncbi:RHS repeat-associated core domain-containing protein [Actinomadura litoris]|uniref:RHS repeat-associated core domain-containing protein n=1 Tax=Actinomadura litoris TaxID=2678616 RepID=A0A7K1KUQ6_9ACTN|nr:RHS repeat-associated core domain-containing protein [Actinomadura litoris]MUN35676.1 hypothetical protein [Actinomadura litoris]
MDEFFTQVGNFGSAVSGGVDPRTGLYNVRIELDSLVANRGLGPSLPLTLTYSPLSSVDWGLGKGVSLGLSTCDRTGRLLSLSTGEQYKVTESAGHGTPVALNQNRLGVVKVTKEEDKGPLWYRIVHKSGDVEILEKKPQADGRWMVPVYVLTPASHGLYMTYRNLDSDDRPRLSRIQQDNTEDLLSVTYYADSESGRLVANFKVLPKGNKYQPEGYDIRLVLGKNGLLSEMRHYGRGPKVPPLVWKFTSAEVDGDWGAWITGMTMPGGMTEKVTYSTGRGHRFPLGADLKDLPYAERIVRSPGAEQPEITTSYTYSNSNFLGYVPPGGGSERNSGGKWEKDKDNLYDVVGDYEYHSTERHTDGREIKRRYNKHHLQTREETVLGQCSRAVTITYYADPGKPFDQQPAQFQLPKKQTVTWKGPGTAVSREEVTYSTFDKWGNPETLTEPDGSWTKWEYYPVVGEKDKCPPDPNGYCRLPKRITRTPPKNDPFKAPVYKAEYRYKLYEATGLIVPRVVLKEQEWQYADDKLLSRVEFAYSGATTDPEKLEFGRVTTMTETEYGPDGTAYEAVHGFAFTAEKDKDELSETHTLKTHDGRTAKRAQVRSRFTGRLRSATDAQGNTEVMTYDGLGRLLTRTANPGTDYQAEQVLDYLVGDGKAGSDPFTVTLTDARGNRSREIMDGAGRPILRQRLDRDGDGSWRTVQTLRYDGQGRLAEVSTLDYERAGQKSKETQLLETESFAYDDWDQLATVTSRAGSTRFTQVDPVRRTAKTWMKGPGLVSGSEVAEYNTRGEPIKITRHLSDGTAAGERRLERDGWGRVRSETDACGNATKFDYDPRGRLTVTTLPDDTRIRRSYAPFSPDTLITEVAVGAVPYGTQSFDGLGRLTSTASGGRTWSYAYADDASPRPSTITAPDGREDYTYVRELGNAIIKVKAVGKVPPYTLTRTLNLDRVSGLLTTSSDEMGSAVTGVARDYHPSGLLQAEHITAPYQPKYNTRASYTVGGLDQDFTGTDDTVQKISRDTYGRIKEVMDPGMKVSATYDSLGRMNAWTATDLVSGSTLTTVLTLDDFGREKNRTITSSRNAIWELTQTWQDNDLLSTRTLTRGTTKLRSETFTYNARGQVTRYQCTGAEAPRDQYGQTILEQVFTYDKYGNITACTTQFGPGNRDDATYEFKGSDRCQLTAITHTHASYPSKTELAYDKAGRLTSVRCLDKAGMELPGRRTLAYDPLGRLHEVEEVGTAGAVSTLSQYQYDPLDRLLTQKTTTTTWAFAYRDLLLASEAETVTGAGNGDGRSQGTRLLRLGQTCVAQQRGGSGGQDQPEVRLLGADGKGSVLVAAGGAQDGEHEGKEEYAYTAYGYTPQPSGGPGASLLGYDGQRTDPVLGWLHLGNGYRPYDPSLMRFTVPDSLSPFGPGGINPYAYCLGDPVNRVDPSGHLSWGAWAMIGLGVAGLILTAGVAGAAIVAAGGVAAAWSAASATALTVGALSVVGDVAAIASGALEEVAPRTSEVLGWVALAAGLPAAVRGVSALARAGYRLVRPGSGHIVPIPVRSQYNTTVDRLGPRFTPHTTQAGNKVWTTVAEVRPHHVAEAAEEAAKHGNRVRILSGAHIKDLKTGQLEGKLEFFLRDMSLAKKNVSVWDVMALTDDAGNLRSTSAELRSILQEPGTDVIMAFCYSRDLKAVREILDLKRTKIYVGP